MIRPLRVYERAGFVITRIGGADAPWIARRADGQKIRADTLRGAIDAAAAIGRNERESRP